MSTATAIGWTAATWNPIRGCSRVSEGCRHCYAEQVAASSRMGAPGKPYHGLTKLVGGEPRWTGEVRTAPTDTLLAPLGWRTPRRVFVNSMYERLGAEHPSDLEVLCRPCHERAHRLREAVPTDQLEHISHIIPRALGRLGITVVRGDAA